LRSAMQNIARAFRYFGTFLTRGLPLLFTGARPDVAPGPDRVIVGGDCGWRVPRCPGRASIFWWTRGSTTFCNY